MNKFGKFKHVYLFLIIFILVISLIGSTYAYLSSSVSSSNEVSTGSQGYSFSMHITPIYSNFSLIPMDDTDVIKGINNQCKDKYNRGSCHIYNINVSDFDDKIDAFSGSMVVSLNNITNLSYMVLEEVDNYIEGSCVVIDEVNYCISVSATGIVHNDSLSLGDNYSLVGLEDKNLLLVIWLSNLNESQNSYDIGEYNASIIMSLGGNGGEIKGSINGIINNQLQSEG